MPPAAIRPQGGTGPAGLPAPSWTHSGKSGMHDERLMERIRFGAAAFPRREKPDPRRMTDSILAHLERILNTRRGSAPIADDFGIPDFTDFRTAYPDSQRDLEREIRLTIQKYEPRLRSVRVQFIPFDHEPLSIRFQITARLALDDAEPSVVLHGVLDADGKIRMRP
jgi:type VI secretion system protein